MQVSTITMPKEEAKKKLEAYQAQLCRRTDAEYEAAAAGYQALAEGTPLISLSEVIREGGFDEKMRPKLAVARADRRQVCFRWSSSSTVASFDTNPLNKNGWSNRFYETLTVRIEMGCRHGQKYKVDQWDINIAAYALVPMVPADIRPSGDLSDYFILWEVERWAESPLIAVPDKDPFLLRHLWGDLYAVVAEWLLTDLERLVMAGRRDV